MWISYSMAPNITNQYRNIKKYKILLAPMHETIKRA